MSTTIKPDELVGFRKVLERLRARLRGDLDGMTDKALHQNGPGSNGDLSNVPLHLADQGSDNFERDFTLGLIESEQATLDAIEGALTRLRQGTFGVCTTCRGPIARPRLTALPYAETCIDCARAGESK